MKQVFRAIQSVLGGLGPNADADEALAFAAWARCAGELLRARTAPIEFSENRLIIAVQDETWRRHLEDLSPQMLVKINGSIGQGTVRFIEFRIDATAVDSIREAKKRVAVEFATHEIAPSLAHAAEAIADENLREQFLGAAASYLAQQKQN